MKIKNILISLLVIFAFASCSTTKEAPTLAYFQNLKEAEGALPDNVSDYKIKIQPDDELIITITSSNPEATAIYNVPLGNPSVKGNINTSQSPRLQTYIVDRNGMIQIPVLGEIKASGISTDELAAVIKNRVSEQVKDPFVRVEMINFTVNVMGEVKAPQRMVVGKERFTVLDALAAAGDLTEYGKRDNARDSYRKRQEHLSPHQPHRRQHLCVAILLPPAKRCGVCGAQQNQGRQLKIQPVCSL